MMLDALCSSSTVSEESHSMGCCCGEICCLSCSCAIFFFHNLFAKKMASLFCNPVIHFLNVTLSCILLHHYFICFLW